MGFFLWDFGRGSKTLASSIVFRVGILAGEGDLWPPPLFWGWDMGDARKSIQDSFTSATGVSNSADRLNRIAKSAMGFGSPEDEEEKKRRQKNAIERRAGFFSDTTGE